jgi:hypothetical protein
MIWMNMCLDEHMQNWPELKFNNELNLCYKTRKSQHYLIKRSKEKNLVIMHLKKLSKSYAEDRLNNMLTVNENYTEVLIKNRSIRERNLNQI